MRRARLARLVNVDDFERAARRRLPRVAYDAIAGGATDEVTMRANREAFGRLWLRPRALPDLTGFDMSTTVLGQPIAFPVLLAPTGFGRLCHPEAEVGAARAAARAGTVFVVSGASSQSLEEIAESVATRPSGTSRPWYQLYVRPTREETLDFVVRAKRAGYPVLCLTIDAGVTGKRERDVRNGLTIPVRMSPRVVLSGLTRPRWTKEFLLGDVGRLRGDGASGTIFASRGALVRFSTAVHSMRMPTWDDLAFIRESWDGPLAVKGVMRADEVPRMIDLGVDAVVVSNHGGRIVDSVRPSLEVLPEVVEAADGRIEVLMDGGVRRGTDVVKALALGARAVLVGRPYVWGLAVGGSRGVEAVIDILRAETQVALAFCGATAVDEVDASLVCGVAGSAHDVAEGRSGA